ncbi:MAG: DnaJ domain-containing protein [Oscillospiraceae bacterium]|jgi:curved DNA-binding protein CbpA|nr:DnaJ domain-containing protein [Oscillospiraceae bacterium]
MQRNPYEVLGIDPNATDDQLKDAYKRLARKFQADEYKASPLSEIAKQKMRELDEAYDAIVQSRRTAQSGYGGQARQQAYSADYSYGGAQQSAYPDIRAKISANRIDDAETLLDGIPPNMRDAEWNYLKGFISQQRGWFDEAERYFTSACEMDPSNIEYASAFNRVRNNRTGGYRTARGRGRQNSRECSGCDVCSGLLCADCCCECMGGDCISCC